MFGDDFDNLNPAFQDLGAWVDVDAPEEFYEDEWYEGEDDDDFFVEEMDDDFPLSLEYDEGENDMYADGDFYTNDPGDW